MGRLIQFLVIGLAIYVGYRLVTRMLGGTGGRRGGFPCETCRNCKTLFDDGVICSFGSKETFKNETHIANCKDWERAV